MMKTIIFVGAASILLLSSFAFPKNHHGKGKKGMVPALRHKRSGYGSSGCGGGDCVESGSLYGGGCGSSDCMGSVQSSSHSGARYEERSFYEKSLKETESSGSISKIGCDSGRCQRHGGYGRHESSGGGSGNDFYSRGGCRGGGCGRTKGSLGHETSFIGHRQHNSGFKGGCGGGGCGGPKGGFGHRTTFSEGVIYEFGSGGGCEGEGCGGSTGDVAHSKSFRKGRDHGYGSGGGCSGNGCGGWKESSGHTFTTGGCGGNGCGR